MDQPQQFEKKDIYNSHSFTINHKNIHLNKNKQKVVKKRILISSYTPKNTALLKKKKEAFVLSHHQSNNNFNTQTLKSLRNSPIKLKLKTDPNTQKTSNPILEVNEIGSKYSYEFFPKLNHMQRFDARKENQRLEKKLSNMIPQVQSRRKVSQLAQNQRLLKKKRKFHSHMKSISMVEKACKKTKKQKNQSPHNISSRKDEKKFDGQKFNSIQVIRKLKGRGELVVGEYCTSKIDLRNNISLQLVKISREKRHFDDKSNQKKVQNIEKLKKKLLVSIFKSKNMLLSSCDKPVKKNSRYSTIQKQQQ